MLGWSSRKAEQHHSCAQQERVYFHAARLDLFPQLRGDAVLQLWEGLLGAGGGWKVSDATPAGSTCKEAVTDPMAPSAALPLAAGPSPPFVSLMVLSAGSSSCGVPLAVAAWGWWGAACGHQRGGPLGTSYWRGKGKWTQPPAAPSCLFVGSLLLWLDPGVLQCLGPGLSCLLWSQAVASLLSIPADELAPKRGHRGACPLAPGPCAARAGRKGWTWR